MKNTTPKIKKAVETLKGFETMARLYWLNVLVELEQLTRAEAGYIILNHLI